MFALPFTALLSRRLKRSRQALCLVAGVVLAGHLAHCLWLVLPSFYHEGFALPWLTPVIWIGLGGPWLFVFLRQRRAMIEEARGEAGGGEARVRT